jgi:oxygen-dependent protoporphyrinogen oxidase
MSNKKVVVVGAGCAGLSATYTLHKQRIDVVCYEARDAAGGRCRTVSEQGYLFSIGAGSTEPQWETTFQYLNEFGLMNKVFSLQKQRFALIRNGKMHTISMGGGLGYTIKCIPETVKFLFTALPWSTYPQAIKAFRAMFRYSKKVDPKHHNFEALAEVSNVNTEEFVLRHGGPNALKYVFHTFLATMVLARPKDISVAHPISLFALMKGMRSLEGGMGILTAVLYDQVKDSVRLNTPVKKIVIKDNKVVGVETKDGFVEADKVICALDAVVAGQVIPGLPEAMRKALESCKYSSSYYYQFGLEKPIIGGDTDFFVMVNTADEDSIVSWVAKGNRPGEKPVIIVATRGWEDDKIANLTPEERRRLVIKEVQRILPKFPDEPVITKLFRWDRAVNLEAPGQFVAIQDLLKNHMRDVEGLYLSGEYLFLIACTEGALATGKQAALSVIEDLRR